jgi:Fe-Mn family superoxide dismutase
MKNYKAIPLPYSYKSLEPFIDEKTMFIHYNKHYMGYLNNLNEEFNKNNLMVVPIRDLIQNIDEFNVNIRNNAGGYYNHSLFWKMLKPNDGSDNLPTGIIKKLIERDFESTLNFRSLIEKSAKKRFGSGWVWWVLMPNGETRIISTPYQDNPQMYFDCEILLGIDVWEHAYYLKYNADRIKYVDSIFKVINWKYPESVIKNYGKRML